MTDEQLRPDGKPFVFDNRGRCPRTVIENNDHGQAILMNQFTGESLLIEERPFATQGLRRAVARLQAKGRGA
jgi:hypothetical protein